MQKIPRLPAAEQSLAPASRASEHLPAAIGHNGGRPLHEDLFDGAEEIAVEMFGSSKHRRRVYHLAETGQIPVFRLGSKICARKSVLRARIAQQEAGEPGGARVMKKPVPITLTEGINRAGQEALVELILHTFPGQAHLAGSGPCGRTCGECGFCACRNSSGRAGPGDQSSASAPCLKARQLSHGRCQSEIPHFAAACRHFEPTEPNEEVKTSD